MRKILLATTALVAFTGFAHAAEAPVTVNVGGYVDFRAGHFNESTNNATGAADRREYDFETEYRLNISAEGKAANGTEYGGLVSLWNGAEYNDTSSSANALGSNPGFTGGGNGVRADQAYVWLSGSWGKVVLGDDHGASDLNVYAPTVGEGQVDGTYTDFTDPTTLAVFQPGYVDEAENNTKITFYTPKIGNDHHKIQVGVSYAPNAYDMGQNVVKYENNSSPYYADFVEATAQYNGNWSPVQTVISATLQTGTSGFNNTTPSSTLHDFTLWGLGAQATYAGFTLGGSYTDAGRFGTMQGQNQDQSVWSLGLKYEFDKVALAINGLQGEGYYNLFNVQGTGATVDNMNYVDDFRALGLGATYTWFPGLTTAADAVFFAQERDDTISGSDAGKNYGHVIMVSQKITF